jgi:predicted DNA-binding transcriptional regulator YafY
MEALAVAALAARSILAPTPLAAALDAAAARLRTDWLARAITFEADADAALWSFDGATGGQPPDTEPTLFRDLLAAVRHQNPIRAVYYTASRATLTTGRRLAPLGFLVRSGAWLVAAADLDASPDDHGHPPIKDFALAGFRSVERLEREHAAPPDGFELALYARDRFGALDGEVEEVRLLVEPEAVPAFKRKLYNPTQQIEEEREDGRAVVSFEAGGLDAVKAWCLSWGPKVKVLAPASLAEQVAAAHREAADRYHES